MEKQVQQLFISYAMLPQLILEALIKDYKLIYLVTPEKKD